MKMYHFCGVFRLGLLFQTLTDNMFFECQYHSELWIVTDPTSWSPSSTLCSTYEQKKKTKQSARIQHKYIYIYNREEKWSVFAQNNISLCEDIFQRVFVSQILVKKTNIVLLGKGVKKELGFRKSPKMESGAIINPSTPTPASSNKE